MWVAFLVDIFYCQTGLYANNPSRRYVVFWHPNSFVLAAVVLSDRRQWWFFILAITPHLSICKHGFWLFSSSYGHILFLKYAEVFLNAIAIRFVTNNRTIGFSSLRETVAFILAPGPAATEIIVEFLSKNFCEIPLQENCYIILSIQFCLSCVRI